ncbi:aldo/keto reductase [Syntrophorhabdus aromaticivorans]|uniref:Aldo/keto reductase n=1 Tax=Syntrophorhabdus aromaticivorans TaxID=328301 RepID=A0A971M5C2_9BACT|nr:aldo/keto reductase [Syntrophorhabdus aromaticivorans]NLW35426.1 aldo/keto reductase [Syntrophorhabdus aromaticivorans]
MRNEAMHEKSDGTISRMILGTWAMGGNHWGFCDDVEALRAIDTALDNGINAIDTAPVYGDGHAEELVGKAIQGKRDKVFLATKCGLDIYSRKYERNLSPSYIERDLSQSLKRLKTDYIDLYQCHWPDPQTPVEETMAALLRFREEGKIRLIGVSNFNDDELREAMRCAPLFSLQSHYSLLERSVEQSTLPICRENDINFFSYGSLGAGVLTGKYREQPRFSRGDARSFFYRFFKPRYWPKVRLLVDGLEETARSKGTRPGVIALSWLIKQPGVRSVIVGARSSEQVLDNIADVPVELNAREMELLDHLSGAIYSC